MAEGVTFDLDSARRIADVVRTVEGGGELPGGPVPSSRDRQALRITSATVDGDGNYPAQIIRPDPTTAPSTWTDLAECRVQALTGTLSVGRCWGTRIGRTDDGLALFSVGDASASDSGCSLAALQTSDCLTATGPSNSVTLTYATGAWRGSGLSTPVGSLDVVFWFSGGQTHLSLGGVETLSCGDGCFTAGPLTGHAHATAAACAGSTFSVCVTCVACDDGSGSGSGGGDLCCGIPPDVPSTLKLCVTHGGGSLCGSATVPVLLNAVWDSVNQGWFVNHVDDNWSLFGWLGCWPYSDQPGFPGDPPHYAFVGSLSCDGIGVVFMAQYLNQTELLTPAVCEPFHAKLSLYGGSLILEYTEDGAGCDGSGSGSGSSSDHGTDCCPDGIAETLYLTVDSGCPCAGAESPITLSYYGLVFGADLWYSASFDCSGHTLQYGLQCGGSGELTLFMICDGVATGMSGTGTDCGPPLSATFETATTNACCTTAATYTVTETAP